MSLSSRSLEVVIMLTRNDASGSPVRPAYRHSPHAMALLAAVFTLPLLFVGGSVTTYGVGMAVPDWPATFGINMFLFDFWNAPFGVRVEHAHRLYGAAVGLATIGLAVWFFCFEPRRWMKLLGVVALLAVIGQGILGGTRVTQVSTFLAAVHGCTAQAFFGLMVALCVLTGRDWLSAAIREPDIHRFRRRAVVMPKKHPTTTRARSSPQRSPRALAGLALDGHCAAMTAPDAPGDDQTDAQMIGRGGCCRGRQRAV